MSALYLFIDEGGNLDFSPTGTRYFTITSVRTSRPFVLDAPLTELRFDLVESGLDLEYFHAAQDRQPTRNAVFKLISSELDAFRVDSVIVEKRKTGRALRVSNRFYPKMLGYLIRYVINGTDLAEWSEVIVITDRLPVNKKRRAVEKAIKVTLESMLPGDVTHRVLHHNSSSCVGLQIADYFNWAIYRKWDQEDHRSYTTISSSVRSEFDIFRTGTFIWY